MEDVRLLSRRRMLLGTGLMGLGCISAPLWAKEQPRREPGALELQNLHTGETLRVTARDGQLDERSAASLQHLLRDHRCDEEHAMDAGLYTQLLQLAAAAGVDARFEIISGYRSATSNASMHERSKGVASKSLHVEGRALDVRLKQVDCLRLAELARAQQWGGVGYYGRDAFVHLDTGRVRTWNG